MKAFFFTVLALLATVSLHAATYSWVDGRGVQHYTDDYAKVPAAYRHKVKQRDDVRQDVVQESPPQATPQAGVTAGQAVTATSGGNGAAELFGGKSRAAWQAEMAALEAELVAIVQRTEQLRQQLSGEINMPIGRFEQLKREYGESRETYDRKYKSYTELIETIRKAGIIVEIRK